MPKYKKKSNRYLIIGSNSFSGSAIINYLLDKEYHVAGISRSQELKKEFSPYYYNKNKKNFKFKKINIVTNPKKLFLFVKKFKPSVVINYAAQGMVEESWKNPEDWYITNLVTQSLIYKKLSKQKYIKRFIHVTTPEVYGSTKKNIVENNNFNPSTPYAISRAAMDTHLLNYFKNFKMPIILTRTSNIYGPYQPLYRIIPKAFLCCKKKIMLNLHGGGKSIRSFIYSDDVSAATYIISKKGKFGETYHISNSEFISIKNLIKKITKIETINYKKFCKITTDRVGKDHSYKLNYQKLKKLGWKPKINLNIGLLKTKLWVDKNIKELNKTSLSYKHKK